MKFFREYYQYISLALYAILFVWCVIYEQRTGRFGGEGFLLIAIPFAVYILTRKEVDAGENKD